MRITNVIIFALWLCVLPAQSGTVDPESVWNSRCDQCHGTHDEFAGKYLWAIDGQLQGVHHVRDLRRFLSNHYAPDHLIDDLQALLARHANTADRFASECGACHGPVETFARTSIEYRWRKVRGVKSGLALDDYLAKHENLQAEDAEFFARLLERFVERSEAGGTGTQN